MTGRKWAVGVAEGMELSRLVRRHALKCTSCVQQVYHMLEQEPRYSALVAYLHCWMQHMGWAMLSCCMRLE